MTRDHSTLGALLVATLMTFASTTLLAEGGPDDDSDYGRVSVDSKDDTPSDNPIGR